MNWQAIEISGYFYFSTQGYRILVSLVHNNDYDFVAEKDGKFIRVNVKIAGLKNRKTPNSWSISIASGSGKRMGNPADIDIYLAWLPHQERFIELPGDFFKESLSKSKLIPKELLK